MKHLVNDFGADPTGQTDSTTALQAAANYGGDIEMGEGVFLTTGFVATKPIRLLGERWNSVLLAASSMAPGTPVVLLSPDPQYGAGGYELMDFRVAPEGPTGNATAIVMATTVAGQYLSMPKLRGLVIGQMNVNAIVSVSNNSDGLAALEISGCVVMGGITLNNVGDSLQIDKNIITGTNIGVFASFVPGATAPAITRNNITNQGGAVYLINASQADISRNNIEHVVYGYAGGVDASVYLQNSRMCDVRQNSINGGNQCGNVRLNNCTRTAVARNTLITQLPHKHVYTQGGYGNANTDNQYIDSSTGNEVGGYF